MTLDEAITIVAEMLLSGVADDAQHEWENYPDIGENDWDAVITKAADLAPLPDADEYRQAYDLLSARATQLGRGL